MRVREAYVHITHVWLPRCPCKLSLAAASIDQRTSGICVRVFVCRHSHVHVHTQGAHTCTCMQYAMLLSVS